MTLEQERLWNNLNDPPYTAFRKSSKLAKPEKGTLGWLIHGEVVDHNYERSNGNMPQQSLCMEDFILWRDSSKSESLLVTAPPGRGKSVLSNFVLGHLESGILQKAPPASKVIYYFCNIKNDEASRNARSVLRALIVQLCEHQEHLFRLLPPEYETDHDRFFSASFDTLWHVFEKMLRSDAYAEIRCVIDGLDVYHDEMDELVCQLTRAFEPQEQKAGRVLKLLCTSRPEKAILNCWGSSMRRILRCNQGDLTVFIDSRVKFLGESFTGDMKEFTKQQLQMQADGTFLWLEIVIRRIRSIDMPTSRKIEQTIKASPQELDRLYEVLVRRLVERDGDNARLLAWVIYAQRPLDLEELEDAMAIDPSEAYTNYDQCLEDRPRLTPEEMHKAFGTLLDITDGKIYLVHQSVRDYFQRQNPLGAFTKGPPRLIPAHVSMAYLSLEDFGRSKPRAVIFLEQQYALLRYAASYWSLTSKPRLILCNPTIFSVS
jgi:hypothetical protein